MYSGAFRGYVLRILRVLEVFRGSCTADNPGASSTSRFEYLDTPSTSSILGLDSLECFKYLKYFRALYPEYSCYFAVFWLLVLLLLPIIAVFYTILAVFRRFELRGEVILGSVSGFHTILQGTAGTSNTRSVLHVYYIILTFNTADTTFRRSILLIL